MTFRDRLEQLIENKNVSNYKISKDTHISKTTVANYLEGKTVPSKSNIRLLADYFDVNENWLLTGEGEMQRGRHNNEPYLTTKSGTKYYELPNGGYRMRVPFIPIKAYAGYIDNCCDAEFIEELEERDFTVNEIHHGRYYSFEIKGDSMSYIGKGSLYDGDIVLVRELGKQHWKDGLRIDKFPVWIIVLKNTIICKQIVKQNVETGVITCHSLNPSPEYADFEINLNDVVQLLNVIRKESEYSL